MTTTITGSGVTFGTGQSWNDTGGTMAMYAARCWVNYDGTGSVGANQTIRGSGNITSVTKQGTGNWTVNLATAMSSASYNGQFTSNSGPASCVTGIGGTLSLQDGITTSTIKTNSTVPNTFVRDGSICCLTIWG